MRTNRSCTFRNIIYGACTRAPTLSLIYLAFFHMHIPRPHKSVLITINLFINMSWGGKEHWIKGQEVRVQALDFNKLCDFGSVPWLLWALISFV